MMGIYAGTAQPQTDAQGIPQIVKHFDHENALILINYLKYSVNLALIGALMKHFEFRVYCRRKHGFSAKQLVDPEIVFSAKLEG